jgi:Methyltransferase domain
LLPIRPGRPGGHGGYTGPLISQRPARIRGATMGTSSLTIAAALGQYEQSQSGFAVLPQTARHAVLEIGDHMHRLREALRLAELGPDELGPGEVTGPESLVASAFRAAVEPCFDVLSREMDDAGPVAWRAASRFFHDRFGALVDLSPVAARCFHKPLGYAGDFEMMNMVYRNESLGDTLFGRSLSRVVLDSEAGQAVRHRAPYLAGKITAAVSRRAPGRPVRILSVAAGPAMELQLLLREDATLLRAGQTEIALLDQDAGALSHAREQIHALAGQAAVPVTLNCLNTSIRKVITDGLEGSYDLIYSAGLFDYLRDRTARAAAARLVAALAPGGQAVIGNFAAANPTRPLMELFLDWPLHHRSADDLRRIFAGLGTGMAVEQEATGVNLFAVLSS